MPDDKLSAALDEIRRRIAKATDGIEFMPNGEPWPVEDAARLLAALDAALVLAAEWRAKSAELWAQVTLQDCEGASAGFKGIGATVNGDHAKALTVAISRALLGDSDDA